MPRLLLAALLLGPTALATAACATPAGTPPAAPAAAAPAEPASLTAAAPFRVEVVGHGPPLLLLPGLSSDGAVWNGFVAREKDRHECHVFTLAGFAGQPAQGGPVLATQRAALARYIADHKLGRPDVMGHSLGGVLALALAAAEPDRVGRLVIVDSLPFLPDAFMPGATPDMMRPQAEMMRATLVQQTPAERHAQAEQTLKTMITDPARVQEALAWSDASDPATIGQAMLDLFTTDLRPELGKVRAPTLVIGTWAGMQGRVTREQIEQTFRRQYAGLAGARVQISASARHFVMFDDLPGLLAAVDPFLSAPRAAPTR